ncbi:serine hydrolase domain-containing protein [Flavobacterium cerinum]|uniref:Beta-lactamase family protein n=1 Tax=Flavobacterium cerinum TaxID=2502784 RepID=A0ABY5IPE7_9FLAO|nr:serine hydrolase domain-containing protein [Flavobacterium cerinum]UUC44062.1 beta-lactamase family protein [Flavobacterium cerinum]
MRKIICGFSCFLLLGCGGFGSKTTKDIVMDYYHKGKLNGAVLIVKNNQVICDTVLGYLDFKTKTPLQKETPFYIASLAKPITALGIVLLQQENRLAFNDKASQYIKDLPAYLKEVTIHQLLTHTSGVCDYENGFSGKKGLTNQEVMQWLKSQKLQFTPGSKYQYSNSGYIMLALIIEQITGKSMKAFVAEKIWEPLKIEHSFVYDKTTNNIPDRAIGFNEEKEYDDYNWLTVGDGGIYATTGDLYKLDKALRNGSLLNKENAELLYHLPELSDGKKGPYGYGWFVETDKNSKIAMHTGGLAGFRSLFWRDLQNNSTIIVLTNQGDAFPVYNFLDKITKSL